jgi:hypothetical protein
MLSKLLGICFHKRYTWPQSLKGRTYVCCLECGRELPYDWQGLGSLPIQPPVITQPRRIVIDERGLRYE